MNANRKFPEDLLAPLRQAKSLGIRAGKSPHRFIGIWHVIVRDRVFVRSWSVKPDGWFRTFQEDPRGAIQLRGRAIAVRAKPVSDPRLRNDIDRAYLEKYSSQGALKYAKDLGSRKSRATTMELLP